MPAAIGSGRVDAAWVVEPFVEPALAKGRALTYGYDAVPKDFLINVSFTTRQWAGGHPDLVTRFVTAMCEASVSANANQDRSGEIFSTYAKLDPADTAKMSHSHFATELTPSLMQPLIDLSAYNGFKTFPAQELVYSPSP